MRELDPECLACPPVAAASPGFFSRLLDTSDFPARWSCGEWDPLTGWLHIGADVGIWFAYTTIPLLLVTVFLRRRRDLPAPGLFLLFAAFILACGFEHLLEAAIFWWPAYRLAALLKVVTALVSVATVVALARVLPRALELRGPAELEAEVAQRTAELRESEARCARAQERAERADAAKSDFLASMSHELRTPVAAILGTVELLLEEQGDGADGQLEVVRRNARHQLELINDVLELSRIEAGSVELEPAPVRPGDLARQALELVAVQARERGLELRLDAPAEEHVLSIDPLRVRQVLVNLLSNAIKFTERGGVTLALRQEAHAVGTCVTFEVEDTGIGMTPEQLERVFEPYRQAEAATRARFGGTGLGLSISRQLARLMGGDLTAVSREGGGSRFTFTFVGDPAGPRVGEEPAPRQVRPPDLRGVRVLLAEDQPDLALVVRRQLERVGCEVVHAPDGEQALAAFDAAHPDVVLLDLQMPVLDGLEVARELRRRGWAGPVVALTANALERDRERCLASGFDDFATKPLAADDLRRLVERHAQAA